MPTLTELSIFIKDNGVIAGALLTSIVTLLGLIMNGYFQHINTKALCKKDVDLQCQRLNDEKNKALLSIQRDNLIKLHRLLSKLKLRYSKTSQYFTTENGDIEKNRTNYLANRETVHEAMVMAAIYFPKFTDDLNEIYLQTDFAWNAQEEIIKKSTNPTSYPALGSAIEIIEKTINTIQNKISNTAQELEG